MSQKEGVIFDLSKTEFLTPFGIVLLAGTLSECLSLGKEARYQEPKKRITKEFLAGIGFNNFFQIKSINHRIESPNVQLKRIYSLDYSLIDQILEVFGNFIHMSEGVKCSLKLALNELMTNVFDHSESKEGCYVCAQSYPQEKKIRLCIADFGIGILASLRKIPQYGSLNNCYESIKLATQEGVTSRVGKQAGYGLSHINRFIEVNEGKMYILSGDGKAVWNYTGQKKRRKEKQTMQHPLQGTLIELEINADKEGFYFLSSEEDDLF